MTSDLRRVELMDGCMSRRAKTIAISHFAVALMAGTTLAGIPSAALAWPQSSAQGTGPFTWLWRSGDQGDLRHVPQMPSSRGSLFTAVR